MVTLVFETELDLFQVVGGRLPSFPLIPHTLRLEVATICLTHSLHKDRGLGFLLSTEEGWVLRLGDGRGRTGAFKRAIEQECLGFL